MNQGLDCELHVKELAKMVALSQAQMAVKRSFEHRQLQTILDVKKNKL